MKPEKPNKFPTGLPRAKPPSEKSLIRLQSALSPEKSNPIPLGKQPLEKSHGSALKIMPKLQGKIPQWQ